MFHKVLNILLFITASGLLLKQYASASDVKYSYQEKTFYTRLDNFNFVDNRSFPLRYLYNDSYVKDKNSAIFFYTGNEGYIELFAQNSGFIWELAEKLGAYVVFAEHRYYGKSLPFGNSTFNNTDNLQYLTIEQTLEDYAHLIDYLQSGKNLPVVAFGGSYGGMLAAWFRMKYPHIVVGALAASAPIWQFNDLTPCDIFSKIMTSVFAMSSSANCTVNIQNSWNAFINYSSTANGRKQMNDIFKFCKPLKSPEDVNGFLDYLEDVYGNLAMANYPYANDFLAPLPAYPVREFCGYLKDIYQKDDLLKAMQKALSVYTNYTGHLKCLDFDTAFDSSLAGKGWSVQTCNQMVMPMCSFANESMYRNKEWNFTDYSDNCFKQYKFRPILNDITLRYGKKDIRFASNIIFSNGLIDPWSGGGVLHTINKDISIIIIPEVAHHLDLRAENPSDPASVKKARLEESKIIVNWIHDFYNEY